ncbi:MAG: 2,3-bisphosphoglycerate-independent phosphoglycerate mutase [Chloroflexi bacterium]|nr:2,3-bisphosphoglycerate-independent phosphoglycerate mutase [Chloroflexota bacterium]
MSNFELMKSLAISTPSKIVLLVMDGLGGLPRPQDGKTELEAARTPNMDALAAEGVCGLTDPMAPGITPGSGPSHLALFGYDPVVYDIGRGVLEALGVGFDLQQNDLAARGNFCTVDDGGLVTDRRAGRIASEKSAEVCRKLAQIELEGAQLFVLPVKEHRFALVFRGEGLSDELTESDPQRTGLPAAPVRALSPAAQKAARVANEFVEKARSALQDVQPANMVLLRGFSRHPHPPTVEEIYKLKPAAIAAYPMYRGLAKLVGMDVLETGSTPEDEVATLVRRYADFDFFFLHIKPTDSAGEDGDFARKVAAIEAVDALLPRITALQPDVLIITGDHSTPAALKNHSWHPVPFLLHSPWCRTDAAIEFSERACLGGGLGRFRATDAMPLAMAHALKLEKYGA